MDDVAVVILAAGKGTRMNSDLPKVLHRVAGKSMVVHVVECARTIVRDHIHVVVGHQAEAVKTEVLKSGFVHFALQETLLGTGDALKAALPDISQHIKTVLVLCGDVPLIRTQTLKALVEAHAASKAALSVLAVEKKEPYGYGRIVTDTAGRLTAIREEADASEGERRITWVNSGIYCFARDFLEKSIPLIKNNNEQAEYYLTDLVEIAVSQGETTHVMTHGDSDQVMGVNTPSELARADALFREGTAELP